MIPREKMLCDYSFNIEEAIEEIKQKIKQATEPRLMIDEKGNLKELK